MNATPPVQPDPGGVGVPERSEAEFRGVVTDGDRSAPRRWIGFVVVVAVALLAVNLLPSSETAVGRGEIASGTPPLSSAPSHDPANPVMSLVEHARIPAGTYAIPWLDGQIIRTVPEGWLSEDAGWTVRRIDGTAGILRLHPAVARVATEVCVEEPPIQPVGPSAVDLVEALETLPQVGGSQTRVDGIDGYPAWRLELVLPASCPRPFDGVALWEDIAGARFVPAPDSTLGITVIDVGGERLVMTSQCRSCSKDEAAELTAIAASLRIAPGPVQPGIGRQEAGAGGIRFSLKPPTSNWERHGGSLNKSDHGPQGAEALIYWTAYPDGPDTLERCPWILDIGDDPTSELLAAAVATAPGTELVRGPTGVSVGGRHATSVIVEVREGLGCDPGYFHAWHELELGAFWGGTASGTTIEVWLVDVGETVLFIQAQILPDAGHRLHEEVQQTVASIRFEPSGVSAGG